MSTDTSYSNRDTAALGFPHRKRRRWLHVLLALVLFGSGAVTGAGLAVVMLVHHVQYALHHPDEFPMHAAARLRRPLHLSAEQQTAVEDILRKHQIELQKIHGEVRPRVMAELEGAHAEIAGVLSAEQKAEWDRWFKDKLDRWLPTVAESRPAP